MLELKTHEDYTNFGILCQIRGSSDYGILGKNPFMEILNVPAQVPFDYMHLVLQGHTKWLITRWFFENDSSIYIGKEASRVNSILALIQLPNCFNRAFPEISKKLSYKSSELKLFIFYTCLPLLINILPYKYWCLLFLYVVSIRTCYEPVK